MKIHLVPTPLVRQAADGWLFFVFQDEPLPVPGSDALSRRLDRMLKDWRARHDFSGKLNQTAVLASWESLPARTLVLAGLGRKKDFHLARLGQAAASAARAIRRHRCANLAVSLRLPGCPGDPPPETIGETLTAALHYGHYAFTRFFSSSKERKGEKVPDLVFTDAPAGSPGLARRLSEAAAA
ncbi:MAG: hypothetical protein KKC51_05485, partial [Verrucomicrobia bacterium]|nr:hypothetical protein [Verrucomicrobiota bacterium]